MSNATALEASMIAGGFPPGDLSSPYTQVILQAGLANLKKNTLLLQSALNNKGRVVVSGKPGQYYLDQHVIYSDTYYEVEQGVILTQAPGTNKYMIANDAFVNRNAASSITISCAFGSKLATINWTNHGKTMGDKIWIQQSDTAQPYSVFKGVFPVQNVVDANTLQIYLERAFEGNKVVSYQRTGTNLAQLQTLTPHGFTTGELKDVSGFTGTPANLNGTGLAVTVVDSKTFTYASSAANIGLTQDPLGPARVSPAVGQLIPGTFTARSADQNILLNVKGAYDFNYRNNNTAANAYDAHVGLFGGIDNFHVGNFRARDTKKYIMLTGALRNYRIFNVASHDYINSDGLKVYGPAFHGVIDGINCNWQTSGSASDDAISLQGKEDDAFASYRFTYGDILQCKVLNTHANNEYVANAVSIYTSLDEFTDGILVDGVFGPAKIGVNIGSGTNMTSGCILGSVDIKNINIRSIPGGASGLGVFVSMSGTYDRITIDGYNETTNALLSYTLSHGAGAADSNLLELKNFKVNGTKGSAVCLFNSVPHNIKVSGMVFKNNVPYSASLLDFNMTAAGKLYNLIVDGCDIVNGGNLINFRANSFTNVPSVTLSNNYIGALAGVASNVSFKLKTFNNKFNSCSNGIVRFNGTASPVCEWFGGEGDEYTGTGTVACVQTGAANATGGLLKAYGFPLKLDVGATYMDKTTSGQFLFNSGAARGTLVQNRLVTCNGTNFVQVDASGNVF